MYECERTKNYRIAFGVRSQTKLLNTALRAHLFYQLYPPVQILQTLSEKSELSEILQTLSGEFDQSPQQPICQTLSGKKKTGKEYYNSLLVLLGVMNKIWR